MEKNETHSFDLLFRGIEITTGGQRIHEYDMLINNVKYKGLNPERNIITTLLYLNMECLCMVALPLDLKE